MYKFYIRMDDDVFGPYSAKGMMELELLPDIMVTEASIDTWKAAENFDFNALAKAQLLERIKAAPTNNNVEIEPTIEQKKAALKERLLSPLPIYAMDDKKSNIQMTANKFPDKLEYKANFNEGINSIGGKIFITPTQLIFHPHSINFGDLSDRVFEISHISGYEKGILSFMYIIFLDGSRIKLTVWNKSEIISQLEARRTSILG